MKTCFISAPTGAKLDVLRASLESRGVRLLVPRDLTVGADWTFEIHKQLSRADLVIGVLTSDRQSQGVFFELGQASALGRRIVILAPPKAGPLPFPLHQFLVLRVELDNQEAIGFALDQLLSAPNRPEAGYAPHAPTMATLGTKADDLIAALDNYSLTSNWRAVEQVVADAIRSAGADVVVTSQTQDIGADFAVWSDVLEPFVGNPLLVEVKGRIRSKADANRAMRQLASFLGASASRWGLLLYGEGPDPESQQWIGAPPNILVLSLRSFLEALRTRAFPELVRDLRNRRIHGSIA